MIPSALDARANMITIFSYRIYLEKTLGYRSGLSLQAGSSSITSQLLNGSADVISLPFDRLHHAQVHQSLCVMALIVYAGADKVGNTGPAGLTCCADSAMMNQGSRVFQQGRKRGIIKMDDTIRRSIG